MYGWRHNFPHQMYNYILYIIFNYEGYADVRLNEILSHKRSFAVPLMIESNSVKANPSLKGSPKCWKTYQVFTRLVKTTK